MSTFWKRAGINYIQYSSICANAVRRCLKPEFQADAEKRSETLIKTFKWVEGKPILPDVAKKPAAASS
ncbi:ATP synthase F(1) complex subunit epsilon, mitochondrial-like [Mytilus galloprovincialis]|uniref:ATP synthase F(1) complex subunit epsilon, mitochondrial-like n=1 Tax=Mytilus galloprovincialis TaxID=29158 RepID=UPI003F7C48C3